MDNLTHSLAGAVLGRMGLKRLSPRAMPALIIARQFAGHRQLDRAARSASRRRTFHRGFTHGDRRAPRHAIGCSGNHSAVGKVAARQRRAGQGLGGLLLACFIGVLSHPALDFLNTYGVRLLEPFSHRWFYGDTLFIVDPWIWIMLILGLEFSWFAERRGRNWTRPAVARFRGACSPISASTRSISARAVAATRPLVARHRAAAHDRRRRGAAAVLASPGDVARRQAVGQLRIIRRSTGSKLDPKIVPLNLDDPRLAAAARTDPDVCNFLFWSRMPLVIQQDGNAPISATSVSRCAAPRHASSSRSTSGK